jgi:hypothetical protein
MLVSLNAQIVLNTGDTFTFEFSSLPFLETAGVINGNPGCAITVFHETGDFRFETFENSTADVPFISDTSGNIGSPRFWYGASSCWQDLQGVVRFTALSGPVIIDQFQVDAYVPNGAMDVFSVIVVPEPSIVSLMLATLFMIGMYRLIIRRSERRHRVTVAIGASCGRRS